jgi:hypothetical protein
LVGVIKIKLSTEEIRTGVMVIKNILYHDLPRRIDQARQRPSSGNTRVSVVWYKLRTPSVPIYHVALRGEESICQNAIELERAPLDESHVLGAGWNWDPHPSIVQQLPDIDICLEEMVKFADSLPPDYILFKNDCRHFVSDMLVHLYKLE